MPTTARGYYYDRSSGSIEESSIVAMLEDGTVESYDNPYSAPRYFDSPALRERAVAIYWIRTKRYPSATYGLFDKGRVYRVWKRDAK